MEHMYSLMDTGNMVPADSIAATASSYGILAVGAMLRYFAKVFGHHSSSMNY